YHLFFHQYPVLKPEFKDFQWNLSTQDYFDCGGYRYRALTALKEKISQVDVRFRKGGERCQPVGRAHSQTLKKLFQEFHIPPWERDNAPIFYINNTMIAVADFWVCEGFSDKHKQAFLIEKTCLGINA